MLSTPVYTAKTAHITYALVGCMFTTILFTYTTCVMQEECPALPHLPTVSNTWVNPPGNYVSRLVVSVLCLGLGLLQFPLWMPESAIPRHTCAALRRALWGRVRRSFARPSPRMLMRLGLLSVFCLSWVGAICDNDKNPQCRGNNDIHTTFALTFFVLYNMNMVILTARDPVRGRVGAPLLGLLCLLLKARWAAPWLVELGDETPVAVLEWTDIALAMGWTAWFVGTHRAAATFELLDAAPSAAVAPLAPAALKTPLAAHDACAAAAAAEAPPVAAAPSIFFSTRSICLTVLGLFFGVLVSTTAAMFAEGRVPKGSWPYISDTWVYPPGDWISRWGVVLGVSCALLCQWSLYYLDGKRHLAAHALAAVSLLGLDAVGCVDESEDFPIHAAGAMVFFVGYDAYMLLRTLGLLNKFGRRRHRAKAVQRAGGAVPVRALAAQAALAVLSCAATAARYLPAATVAAAVPSAHVRELLLPILEWADALTIIGYFGVSILSHGDAAKAAGLRLTWS